MNATKSPLATPALIIAGALIVTAALGFVGCQSGPPHRSGSQTQYTCPMHPEVSRAAADACPKCGMKLEEKH